MTTDNDVYTLQELDLEECDKVHPDEYDEVAIEEYDDELLAEIEIDADAAETKRGRDIIDRAMRWFSAAPPGNSGAACRIGKCVEQ